MNQEKILQDLAALPPAAQQMVEEFIAHLHRYCARIQLEEAEPLPAPQDESFIGMWRERADMTNSEEWVRALREREWGQGL